VGSSHVNLEETPSKQEQDSSDNTLSALDIFDTDAQTLVNPINCVGVMGKGLALEFAKRYPVMYEDYRLRCARGEVRVGQPYLWRSPTRWVVGFPTKRHYRSRSRLDDIRRGLKYMVENVSEWGIESLAVPALGCGEGGLDWEAVEPIIRDELARIGIPTILLAPRPTGAGQD